jgi:hypothetical protein
LCLAGAGRTPAGHIQHPVRLAQEKTGAFAGNLPAQGHWIDTNDGTTYLVQFKPNPKGFSAFDFTTPKGQQLEGAFPLVTLGDGTLAQGTGIHPGAQAIQPTLVSTSCLDGVLQSDTNNPANPDVFAYTFVAHISSDGLAAFATLSYVSTQDQAAVAEFCKGIQVPGVTTYQLSSGCTLTSCNDLTAITGPTVASYDAALLQAEQNGNWDDVYKQTSRQVTAQYQAGDFAALLNQQVAAIGKITSISTPLTNPVVEFTPEGQAYFAVTQTVTFQHSGANHSQELTSYYILENGIWDYWFSS